MKSEKIYRPEDLHFSADLHFDHEMMIRLGYRPFRSVDEMNRAIIKNWNAVVPKNGIAYILGDVGFSKPAKLYPLIAQLNGKLNLIMGNHDKLSMSFYESLFENVYDFKEIRVKDGDEWQHISMLHYAMKVWNKSHYGSWQLYGHSHNSLYSDPYSRSMDVGVDGNDFAPWSYAEIKEVMAKKTWRPIDHHDANYPANGDD